MEAQRHQPDYVLFFTILLLCAVGVVTIFSASMPAALHYSASHPKTPIPADNMAVRQLLAAGMGLVILTILMHWIHYEYWYRRAVLLLLVNFALLTLVLIPGIGHVSGGSRRWFGSGSFHIQPSEIAIVLSVIYLAYFFTRKVVVLDDFRLGLRPALIVIGIEVLLVFMEPDMGTALTLLATSLTVVFASGVRLRRLFILGAIMLPVMVAAAFLSSYRSDRMSAWLHPFADKGNTGYQLLQGWTAMASGGWFGRGFGMGIAQTGYLPVPQADFIYPVFVEEWGFVGGATLLVIFGVLAWRGFLIARKAPNRFSALVAVGLTSMIVIKAVINLGAVTGLLPVTGVPLPFISYGGTSLVVNLTAMGILLNISRYTLDVEPEADQLADVIAVDEVRAERAQAKPSLERTTPAFSAGYPGGFRKQPSRNNVTQLRPKRLRGETPRRESWRSRQETAASLSRRERERGPREPVIVSWRERNRSQSDPTKSRKGKKPSRRDRD
ncbi:MAG: FtsW/RodA/SpoVE family cell cycle protein [Alicyclobacillus herbarius]|uniref:FtsW/RodA/SpoVE family cell cycle protein n=1 Tax=Alicyclobacillus herbarius TaxID=122960 RepID=UPI00042806D4|nr:FtsW/RodA/SpoVE family cell cycle protein [Alicyclobacillus herbarius]MCL6631563.1 FtsW/RodA/SpoVE family cell cycle protein [Alicyclobacillus herbarius]